MTPSTIIATCRQRAGLTQTEAPRLRFVVKLPHSHRFPTRRPRQFPEPKKGFDIAKIAKVIAEHVGEAGKRAATEQREEDAYLSGVATLWHAIGDCGLPESSTEYRSVSAPPHAITKEAIAKHASVMPRGYLATGKDGDLSFGVSRHDGTVSATLSVKAEASGYKEVVAMIRRFCEMAGVETNVCDREALAEQRRAEVQQREQQKEAQA